MKKVVIAVAVLGGTLAALGCIRPLIGQRAMRLCQDIFDRMPEDVPCKQMMRGIDETREQAARLLLLAEEAEGKPAAALG